MEKDRSKRRYKTSHTIGSGSFATVLAAQDLKLNREVAIKQLHPQYLQDQDQLKRYWQEAQLLASLEHSNIMTIFDVIRTKGCLVLERMQGSLNEIYGQNPMPVEEVRQTIIQAAKGLKCLHANGIVHGDIKPGNLFLSRQDVVKLGDFGLARRVNNDDGSLVKGTTRYMAPELVSEEFGDVGAASDLYSLGFSALELLVGPEFESLFPDLIAFGRDRQMAWMMWHCSADRKLPPVQSLLAGVPNDLAHALEKLTTKDQSNRYQTADEVIADLSGHTAPVGKSLKDDAEREELERQQKRRKRRKRLIIVSICSLVLTAAIIILSMPRKQPEARKVPPPVHGIVMNTLPLEQKLVLRIDNNWREFSLRPGDVVTLNRKERQLRDLEEQDRVVVHSRLSDEDSKIRYDIVAFRPETHTGVIGEKPDDATEEQFLLTVSEGEDSGTDFLLAAPAETPITLNSLDTENDQPLTVASLAPGDRVVVRHSDDEEGMLALSIDALRDTTTQGFARKIDLRNQTITVALDEAEQDANRFVRIPLDADCTVELNGLASINEKQVRISDVQPGDEVTLVHDVKVKTIAAFRVFYDAGDIQSINLENNTLRVSGSTGAGTYTIGEDLEISLGSETVKLSDLRVGDRVKLSHIFPGSDSPKPKTLDVTRPTDRSKWAILIANDTFKDSLITPLSSPSNSVRKLSASLMGRYAVPESQTFICENLERVRLMQELPTWINRVPENAELLVYVSTRAYTELQENVYLATADSNRESIDETGLRLDWLIDLLDSCQSTQKLLMLDCTHPDSNTDPTQYSTTRMIDTVRSTRRGGYPRSVYVLASCDEGQVGSRLSGDDPPSLFASVIADGFSGAADLVSDNKIEITELANYVENTVQGRAGAANQSQRPVLILPDASPPRISLEAKQAIIDLLARFSQKKLDLEQVAEDVASAGRLSGDQPEPDLAHGILLMKANKMDQALEIFDRVRLQHPHSIPAYRGAAWLHFYKLRYGSGLSTLRGMLDQIPVPEEIEGDYSERYLRVFEWAGRLRELAGSADWTERLPSQDDLNQFDMAMQRFGELAQKRHHAGREYVKNIVSAFNADIAEDPASSSKLKKRRIRSYMGSVANEELIQTIKLGLDK